MKWFEADTIWDSLYKITTKEDFVEQFVVESKFHNKVPKDIVDAFETVSYLLANSYYHYNLLDVALNKMLLIIEMAVKLKAKELNIPLKLEPNKQGKAIDKKLFKLIDEVCKEAKLEFLIPDFDRARNLRNSFMHPERHSVMGIFAATTKNYVHFNNVINQLFLDEKSISELIEKREQIKNKVDEFKNSLFVLDNSKERILMDTIHYHKYFKYKDLELLFLFINPLMMNIYERLTNHRFDHPMIIILKQFNINNSEIKGFDLDGNEITIQFTEELENVSKLKTYSDELNKVSKEHIDIFNAYRSGIALWEIDKVVYNNLWE